MDIKSINPNNLPEGLLKKFNRKSKMYTHLSSLHFVKSGCGKYWRMIKDERALERLLMKGEKDVYSFFKSSSGGWKLKLNNKPLKTPITNKSDKLYSFGGGGMGSPGTSSLGSGGLGANTNRGLIALGPDYHEQSLAKIKRHLLKNKSVNE